jgi:hypothetical protein
MLLINLQLIPNLVASHRLDGVAVPLLAVVLQRRIMVCKYLECVHVEERRQRRG